MSSEQVVAGPVELSYTLTKDDWLDGFIAHRRQLRRPWLVPLVIVAAVVGLVLAGGFRHLSARDVATLGISALVAIGIGLLLFRVLIAARWMYRWPVLLIMRGNPWLTEPIRATVDHTGLRLTSASRSETSAWSNYLRYVETDRSFVLRASERLGAAILVLPKRGLVTRDPAPLRELLEAHCHTA
jgi:hypothetical protein